MRRGLWARFPGLCRAGRCWAHRLPREGVRAVPRAGAPPGCWPGPGEPGTCGPCLGAGRERPPARGVRAAVSQAWGPRLGGGAAAGRGSRSLSQRDSGLGDSVRGAVRGSDRGVQEMPLNRGEEARTWRGAGAGSPQGARPFLQRPLPLLESRGPRPPPRPRPALHEGGGPHTRPVVATTLTSEFQARVERGPWHERD